MRSASPTGRRASAAPMRASGARAHHDDHLRLLATGLVRIEFKRPWSNGTNAIALSPTAFIARRATLVPPPRRHVIRYFDVLSSHSTLRPNVVPSPPCTAAGPEPHTQPTADRADRRRRYITWAELLRRTFEIDVVCQGCSGNLRLIALVKAEETTSKILNAMGLPAEPPLVSAARPPPQQPLWTSPRP